MSISSISEVDPYLRERWQATEIDCVNLAKLFIQEFSIEDFLDTFFTGLNHIADGSTIDFVNRHIFHSKSWSQQEQVVSAPAIPFVEHHTKNNGLLRHTQLETYRIFEEHMEMKCVTVHSDAELGKRSKKLKNALTSLKNKLCCGSSSNAINNNNNNNNNVAGNNSTDTNEPDAPSYNRYHITTWSLCGHAHIEQQMDMLHCLTFETKTLQAARIEMDAEAKYIAIIHESRVNIISRHHLLDNNIKQIDSVELARQGVQIDDYLPIFDVRFFYNRRFSQNLLLGIVLDNTSEDQYKFIIIDCRTKRVRRRQISCNGLKFQFLKYPHLSNDTLFGECKPSDSKEMSIGIMGHHNDAVDTGLQKFAQYYLLRNSSNTSKSWVKASNNGRYLAHFSGMNRDKIQYSTDRNVSFRLGIIKVPHNSTANDADLTITFDTKPCGFTISQDENKCNAWISEVRKDNPYRKQGLKVGLWIHTVNMKVVDNNPYRTILSVIRRSPAPVTIGFKYSRPSPCIRPEKLGTHFWYNTSLTLPNDTVCNGIHWLSDNMVVIVIGHKLYVLGQNTGARCRNKVLQIWMNQAYNMINYDIRGIIHNFVGFDLDSVYDLPDMQHATSKNTKLKALVDFYCYKEDKLYCVYQDNKQQKKLMVL